MSPVDMDNEQLSPSQARVMDAFELLTSGGERPVESLELSPAEQAQLEDFLQVHRDAERAWFSTATAPSVRGRVMSMAAAAHAQPASAPWWEAWLRPAPVAGFGLVAAALVAIVIRPPEDPRHSSQALEAPVAGAPVAMNRPSPRPAPAAESVANEPPPAQANEPVVRPAAEAEPRQGASTDDSLPEVLKTTKHIEAKPASLGPAPKEEAPLGELLAAKLAKPKRVKRASSQDLALREAMQEAVKSPLVARQGRGVAAMAPTAPADAGKDLDEERVRSMVKQANMRAQQAAPASAKAVAAAAPARADAAPRAEAAPPASPTSAAGDARPPPSARSARADASATTLSRLKLKVSQARSVDAKRKALRVFLTRARALNDAAAVTWAKAELKKLDAATQ